MKRHSASRQLCVGVLVIALCEANAALVASRRHADGNNSKHPPQHAKLDLGLAEFEANLTAQVDRAIVSGLSLAGSFWTSDMRRRLSDNVTSSLNLTLEESLKPVKEVIGQTWMALPQEDQQAHYVESLRAGFSSTLERSKDTVLNHIGIGLGRVKLLNTHTTRPKTDNVAFDASVEALAAGLVREHCYNGSQASHGQASAANATNASTHGPPPTRSFCVPSAVGSMVRRLNDTVGLVSMSARFEARALALTQASKSGSAHALSR